jgi:hypothetical protein
MMIRGHRDIAVMDNRVRIGQVVVNRHRLSTVFDDVLSDL